VVSVIHIGRGRLRELPGDALGRALALYAEGGKTEREALCAMHAGVLERARALGIRLEGEKE
jgi:hypothetical protein